MGLRDIKKELKKLDKEGLINLISDLYKKDKATKELLDYYVKPNERDLFNKYGDIVFEAFYPTSGYDLKLKNGKKAITDFKKFSPSSELVAELMLFYVATGVNFTNDFGDIDEGFYSSLGTTFAAAMKLMKKENLLEKLAAQVSNIVHETNGIGWGFHEYICEIYWEFYPNEYELVDEPIKQSEEGKIIYLNRKN
jgi:hypothetical protein